MKYLAHNPADPVESPVSVARARTGLYFAKISDIERGQCLMVGYLTASDAMKAGRSLAAAFASIQPGLPL